MDPYESVKSVKSLFQGPHRSLPVRSSMVVGICPCLRVEVELPAGECSGCRTPFPFKFIISLLFSIVELSYLYRIDAIFFQTKDGKHTFGSLAYTREYPRPKSFIYKIGTWSLMLLSISSNKLKTNNHATKCMHGFK